MYFVVDTSLLNEKSSIFDRNTEELRIYPKYNEDGFKYAEYEDVNFIQDLKRPPVSQGGKTTYPYKSSFFILQTKFNILRQGGPNCMFPSGQ